MESTRKHDIGSIRQRIEARREAASLGAALSLFNGKTPYGYSRPKGRKEPRSDVGPQHHCFRNASMSDVFCALPAELPSQ